MYSIVCFWDYYKMDRSMRKILLFVFFSIFGQADAQEYSTNATNDYATDLGQVYGAIRSVEHMKQICTAAFPTNKKNISAAYQQWRKNYQPFIDEIEKHMTNLIWQESNGNRKKYVVLSSTAEKNFIELRGTLKVKMMSGSVGSFSEQCGFYPSYLVLSRMNLEHYYSEQVAVIRKVQHSNSK